MPSRRPVWEQIYKRFDPYEPAEAQAWRADRARSPASDIVELLAMPFGEQRVLVTGTTGTGKSTELLRIAEARSSKDLVVVLDLDKHFQRVVGDADALTRVRSWEVVFLVGLAVVRAVGELLPYPIPPQHIADLAKAWERIAKATGTPDAQVDIGALAKAMIIAASASLPLLGAPAGAAAAGAVGLKVLESVAGAVKWALPIGRAARQLPDQDAEMQTLLAAVNVIIGFVQTKYRRILLVIDGLDKIFQPDQAEALFLRSTMIAQLACHVVVSGPFVLRSNPAAAAVPRFSKICVLCNEPVLQKGDEDVHGSGVPFFCEIYRRRVVDLGAPEIVSDELQKRLAYYSGGRARDFVKSIRMVAERAWLEDAPEATGAIVDRVLDEARRLLETGLDMGHIEVLEKIASDASHRLPADGRARELLDYGQLLPYPNESEWYYPHPLLTLHLVRTSRPGSNG